jgi:PAS domain S-box-containing protein
VFDRYPEPLPLQQLARRLGISAGQLWHEARLQAPIRNATLQVYGELLYLLSKAYLRERYSAILDRKLERVNLRLRHAVDGIKEHALFTVNGLGAVTSWNLGAESLFGHKESDMVGQNFSRLFPEEDIQRDIPGMLLRKASDEGAITDKGWQVRKDGTRFFAEGTLAALGEGPFREFGRLTHDVTRQRSAEEALRQTQKLESIGILASGIAHDFNNLLSGIKGGVGLAMAILPPDHPACPSLLIANKATEKAAELTHQLLAYAGQGKFLVTRFDLSVSVREMLSLLQTSISKSVDLKLALEDHLPWMEGDASQIQQVIMNLVINAAEAIGKERGWLRVSTRTASEGDRGAEHTCAEVCLEVQDSGPGMTDEIKARIFDPFFTTKFSGRGLGLAAVSGIVRGHGGRMLVQSSVGNGTSFQIFFPAVEKGSLEQEKRSIQTLSPGAGVILVVDDESMLRTLARAILERSGYQVLMAENGIEAVEIFRQNASGITAILLDMTMPAMSGEEAFPLLRAIRSDVPIVISTGYSQVTTELLSTDKAFEFIQKPYTPTQLCEAIARVQDRPTEARPDDDSQKL